MRTRGGWSVERAAAVAVVVGSIAAGCSGSSDDPVATASATTVADVAAPATTPDTVVSADAGHAAVVASLTGLLPSDTRGVFAVDLAALTSGDADAALAQVFGALGSLASLTSAVDTGVLTTALLAQTTDAADGMFLLARVQGETIDDVVAGPMPTPDGTYGPASHPLYVDANGNHLALLPGGVLVVGERPVVESVLDVVDGSSPAGASAIVPFLDALADRVTTSASSTACRPCSDDVTPDRSLRGAAVMSGAFDVADGNIGGELGLPHLERGRVRRDLQRPRPARDSRRRHRRRSRSPSPTRSSATSAESS